MSTKKMHLVYQILGPISIREFESLNGLCFDSDVWGLCIALSSRKIMLSRASVEMKLWVSLLDIKTEAATCYSEYGFEELFIMYSVDIETRKASWWLETRKSIEVVRRIISMGMYN